MKKTFLIVAAVFSATLSAQTAKKAAKTSVPAIVQEAFAKEFPKQNAKWSEEGGGYEAEFTLNDTETSAVYDKKGHRKELETEIKPSELPAKALAYLKENYPTSKITEAAKITDDKNVVTYEAEIKKDGKSYDVLLDANGKFIRIN